MELVTVVNRTSRNLEGVWDGKHYTIPPGASAFPIVQAEAFKRQNPVMGSEDPRLGVLTYLIGIVEDRDDCSPLEQTDAIERWDRSKLAGARPTEVVPGDNGLYSVRQLGGTLPSDSTFVKP